MQILIWESNPLQQQLLLRFLQQEGCQAEAFNHYRAVRQALRKAGNQPLLLIVSTALLQPPEQLMRLHELAPLASILAICQTQNVHEHLAWLDAGADAYIVQPYALEVLLAQGQALYRQSQRVLQAPACEHQLPQTHGPLMFQPDRLQVSCRGRSIALNARLFALLLFMSQHPGVVHSRRTLYQQVWPGKTSQHERPIDNLIVALRKHLAAFAEVQIQSIYGKGYSLHWSLG